MTHHGGLRFLPWSGPEGKPCFLSTDGSNSRLSRLADGLEATCLDLAAEVLDHASEVLSRTEGAPVDLRTLSTDLAEALRQALCVAESRGHRLSVPDGGSRTGEGPAPPAPFRR